VRVLLFSFGYGFVHSKLCCYRAFVFSHGCAVFYFLIWLPVFVVFVNNKSLETKNKNKEIFLLNLRCVEIRFVYSSKDVLY
jgi:hypothetical protein